MHSSTSLGNKNHICRSTNRKAKNLLSTITSWGVKGEKEEKAVKKCLNTTDFALQQ